MYICLVLFRSFIAFYTYFSHSCCKTFGMKSSIARVRENTNQDQTETVVTILEDFCEYTTSGGLARVVGTKYFALKILWVIIFFGALTAAILQLITLFETYQHKPISTRISLEHSAVRMITKTFDIATNSFLN